MGTIKAMQAAHELRLEAIDRPPHIDEVRAEGMGRDPVDGLVDERVDRRIHMASRLRYRERLHTQYCSKHLFVHDTDNAVPRRHQFSPYPAITHRVPPVPAVKRAVVQSPMHPAASSSALRLPRHWRSVSQPVSPVWLSVSVLKS